MRRALVVGTNHYPGAPLQGCVSDAVLIADILSVHADGSPNFECNRLLARSPDEITREMLREHIARLFRDEVDVALFYFSGHGTANNLGGYLVTSDAKAYDQGVSLSDLLSSANQSRAREVVIILDCCQSGAFGQIPAIDNRTAFLREGVSVLTASRETQSAVEVSGRGLFTALVCDALEGGAADVLGNVTVAAMYAYVDQVLGAWDQRPLFKSHVSKLIRLRQAKPVVDRAILRRLPELFSSPSAIFPLDPSYEPEAEPKNHEREEVFWNLQQLNRARLVVPVNEEHMYYAAVKSESCELTPLGRFYWLLAKNRRI